MTLIGSTVRLLTWYLDPSPILLFPSTPNFQPNSDLKKRILPILEANAIVQQHHLQYPQARIVDPAKRSSMIVEKLVAKRHRSGKSSTPSQSSSSTAAASSSKTASTTASPSSSSSSSTSTDFVWSLNHNLLPESTQHPSLTDPTLSTTLQDRLSRISSGTESVHLITSQTRAERAASKEQYHESKILHLAQVQNVWKRPQGVLNPRRYGEEAEEWVSSEEERQHWNKRRGLKRVGKERRMVRLVKILGDAYLGKEGQVPTSS
jgi:hypothetical protein